MTLTLKRIKNYSYLMRLHKPIGILLLLWPTWWALWLAGNGQPHWQNVVIFTFGVMIMRSAGCVINDYADRQFDPHVQRTCQRPLANGSVTVKEALLLFAVLVSLAASLLLWLNRVTLLLAIIGLGLTLLYPFTKRFTHWPQLVLGFTFSWGIPMAYAAETGTVPTTAWILYFIAVLWPLAYDTLYGMVDKEDDLKIGIKSTAIYWGRWDKFIVALLECSVLLLLLGLAQCYHLHPLFYLGWLGALVSVIYQQYLIRACQPAQYFQAFLNNNWFGFAIFLGILLGY